METLRHGPCGLNEEAAEKFDEVHWVAAVNPHKGLIFSMEERLEMMKQYVDYYKLKKRKIGRP